MTTAKPAAKKAAGSKVERSRPKTGGRKEGTPNRVTAEFRETVTKLLQDNAQNVGRWLTLVAEGDGSENGKPDPGKALDLVAKLAEYAAPKLNRIEHTGQGGSPLSMLIGQLGSASLPVADE